MKWFKSHTQKFYSRNPQRLGSKASLLFVEDLFPILTEPVIRSGSSGNDILTGRSGNDLLSGESGDDLLLGFRGNDILLGGEGNDLLVGGPGNDLLNGGTGTNFLLGGQGTDTFVLDKDDSFDFIFDYQDGEDQFILRDGLTFAQLAIKQQGNSTLLRYLGSSQPFVLLTNTQAKDLTRDDFRSTPLIPTFDKLFVFGDSLSDPGNLFNLTGELLPPPPYSEGRFSDGDIWTDFLAEDLRLNPTTQVENFSFGGALTGRDNGLEPVLENLTGRPIELPGLLDEIDQFTQALGGEKADSNGLYVIWAGANDLLNLPSNPQDIPAFLANSVQNIVNSVITLASLGADTFLIPNLPDLGLIPRTLSDGSSAIATSLSIEFNSGLDNALTTLEADPLTDIDIVPVDLFSITREITSSPDEFGFTNVTDQLIEQGLADNPGFFWWDQQHPTEKVQSLLSDVFQSNLFDAGYLLNGSEGVSLIRSSFTDVIAGASPTVPGLVSQEVTYSTELGSYDNDAMNSDYPSITIAPELALL